MKCTVCGFSGEPGPVFRSARESRQCPLCGATSRQRAIAHVLARQFNLGNLRDGVLHALHCGSSLNLWQIGADRLSPWFQACCGVGLYAVSELDSPRRGFVAQNVEELTWPDDHWAWTICSEVLEHVRDYRRALIELCRVTRPGGHLLLTVPLVSGDAHRGYCVIKDPSDPAKDEWASDTPRHPDPLEPSGCPVYRVYSPRRLTSEMETIGFDVLQTDPDDPEHGIEDCTVFVGRKRR